MRELRESAIQLMKKYRVLSPDSTKYNKTHPECPFGYYWITNIYNLDKDEWNTSDGYFVGTTAYGIDGEVIDSLVPVFLRKPDSDPDEYYGFFGKVENNKNES